MGAISMVYFPLLGETKNDLGYLGLDRQMVHLQNGTLAHALVDIMEFTTIVVGILIIALLLLLQYKPQRKGKRGKRR